MTTDHRYWVHVPAQYTESEAAALMVFQDGWLYLDPEGEIRAGVVFDDLIEPGEMPVTIGVFVDPCAGQEPRVRRVQRCLRDPSAHRDPPGRTREVQRDRRSGSVGGRRRQQWRQLPRLIEELPVKPLRIFLHAATHDLDWGPGRNWFAANRRVAAALADRGYDFRLTIGDGGHDLRHTGDVLPDALRWLWRR